jgi:hypothetical protein
MSTSAVRGQDYRSMFDNEHIGAWDLPQGRGVVVTIARIKPGKLTGHGGKTTTKPIIYFEGHEKGMACNKVNGKTIAKMFGTVVAAEWIGRRIEIYATTTSFGAETVDCIRVKPREPADPRTAQGKTTTAAQPAQEPKKEEPTHV